MSDERLRFLNQQIAKGNLKIRRRLRPDEVLQRIADRAGTGEQAREREKPAKNR